jgi:hypothetical protein
LAISIDQLTIDIISSIAMRAYPGKSIEKGIVRE